MKSIKKISLILLGTLLAGVLLLVIFLLSLDYCLKTPTCNQRGIKFLQSKLSDQGIQLEIASLQVELFSHIQMHDLKVSIKKEALGKVEVKLPKFDLLYDLSELFQKKIVIKSLLVEKLQIDGDLEPKPSEAKEEEPSSSEPFDPIAFLKSPPVTFILEDMQIRDLSVNLKIKMPNQEIRAKVHDFSMHMACRLEPGTFVMQGDLQQGSQLHEVAFQSAGDSVLDLGMLLSFANDFDIQVQVVKGQDDKDKIALDIKKYEQKIQLADFNFTQSSEIAKMSANIKDLQVNTVGSVNQVRTDVLIQNLDILQKAQPKDIKLKLAKTELNLSGEWLKDLPGLAGQLALKLNGKDISTVDYKLADLPEELHTAVGVRATVDPWLRELLPELAILRQIGRLDLNLNLNAVLHHGAQSIMVADPEQIPKQPLTAKVDLTLKQTTKPSKRPFLLVLAEPMTLQADVDHQAEQDKIKLKLQLPSFANDQVQAKNIAVNANILKDADGLVTLVNGLELASLRGAAIPKITGIKSRQELKINLNDLATNLVMDAAIVGKKFLDLDLQFANKPRKADLALNFSFAPFAGMTTLFLETDPLQPIGLVKVEGKVDAVLRHSADDIRSLQPSDIDKPQAAAKVELIVTQTEKPAIVVANRVLLPEPLMVDSDVQVLGKKADAKVQVRLAHAVLDGLAGIRRLQTDVGVNVGDYSLPMAASDVKVKTRIDQIELIAVAEKLPEFGRYLSPFTNQISLSVRNQVLNLNEFNLAAAKLVNVGMQGQVKIQEQAGRIAGEVMVNVPSEMKLGEERFQGAGQFKMPWTINLEKGEEIRIQGNGEFMNVSAQLENAGIELRDLNGHFRLIEDLRIDKVQKQIYFAYEIAQNPFERVDFARYEPLVFGLEEMTFREFRFGKISMGPFRGQMDLHQNLLNVGKFDLNLFEGSVSGMMYVNLIPKDLAVGLLSRVTKIKPALLTRQAIASQGEAKTITVRTAIEMQIPQNMLAGRVDVSEIGDDQLLALIDYLDPKREDEQMNKARQALRIAAPSSVTIEMTQGLMDMNIEVDAGILETGINIRRFPLYSFMGSSLSDLNKKLNEVPLQ